MESALIEARGKVAALKDDLPRIDIILAEVEQHTLAKSDEVQDLESQCTHVQLQMD